MTNPEINIAKLQQANLDMNRRFDEFGVILQDIRKSMGNDIPHQIATISDKFDRRFDMQAKDQLGNTELMRNFVEGSIKEVDKKINDMNTGSGDTKLVTKIVLAVCGMILLAFLNNLMGMVFSKVTP